MRTIRTDYYWALVHEPSEFEFCLNKEIAQKAYDRYQESRPGYFELVPIKVETTVITEAEMIPPPERLDEGMEAMEARQRHHEAMAAVYANHLRDKKIKKQ